MADELIKRRDGYVIGRIETHANGDRVARSTDFRILGYYRAASNTTTDFYGRTLSRGDTIVQLIYENLQK